eukprot:CAMPEP_0175711612 /NCGR_PEP_ID=MMETSP0097-20121207/40679_1 /TAXON_ID=311494 /ORGANISM="Alexandrium monilatum, Strain CCMP3105" /LENGTH=202 /DNA_ID=CAMNT_0017019051 /DNA_START=108 /DNA_END=714 /DNA_ORIENTATION=+
MRSLTVQGMSWKAWTTSSAQPSSVASFGAAASAALLTRLIVSSTERRSSETALLSSPLRSLRASFSAPRTSAREVPASAIAFSSALLARAAGHRACACSGASSSAAPRASPRAPASARCRAVAAAERSLARRPSEVVRPCGPSAARRLGACSAWCLCAAVLLVWWGLAQGGGCRRSASRTGGAAVLGWLDTVAEACTGPEAA